MAAGQWVIKTIGVQNASLQTATTAMNTALAAIVPLQGAIPAVGNLTATFDSTGGYTFATLATYQLTS